ncbi:MAG TPA: sigma-E processing peptidase SpoIIGA [Bacillota bacterium]|nr:sigma-E processing peptidase SpoIIGA [Bacillota bacterium]
MTIYLDAVWILNLLLDMMLLLLTQALARERTRKTRIFFGAFIASLLVPLSIYFPHSFWTSIWGKLFYSLLIIICTFRFYSIQRTIKLLFLFYFISFAIGGGLIAAHFLLAEPIGASSSHFLTFHHGYGDPISWYFVIIGFPIAWLFTKIRMDKHVVEKIRYDQLCPVTICMKDQCFSTDGYIDSGNQLIDPLSKSPVILCDEVFLQQWFSQSDWSLLKDAFESLDLDQLPTGWERHIQLVPFYGVEGKSGFLLTLRPEQLTIDYKGDKIVTHKVLIGVQFARLTKDNTYHCLLHPQIIKLAAIHTA